jgi:hypothetical protein
MRENNYDDYDAETCADLANLSSLNPLNDQERGNLRRVSTAEAGNITSLPCELGPAQS